MFVGSGSGSATVNAERRIARSGAPRAILIS
jgi:hypothetical protein